MSVPDIERIVSDHLRTHPEVVSMGTRVVGKTPNNVDTSWVLVRRLDRRRVPLSPVDHLLDCLLQLDCYAGKTGGQPEANNLGDAVRDALNDLNGVSGDAVVTDAQVVGDARISDPHLKDEEGDARERVVMTATVYVHA